MKKKLLVLLLSAVMAVDAVQKMRRPIQKQRQQKTFQL